MSDPLPTFSPSSYDSYSKLSEELQDKLHIIRCLANGFFIETLSDISDLAMLVKALESLSESDLAKVNAILKSEFGPPPS